MLSKILKKSIRSTVCGSKRFSTIPNVLKQTNYLEKRHLGSSGERVEAMLKTLNVKTVDELIQATIPGHILDPNALEYNGSKIPDEPKTEEETLKHLSDLS